MRGYGEYMSTSVKKMTKGQRGDFLFHLALIAWPILQFIVFYIVVNVNSFKLAFEGVYGGFSFEHFKYVFSDAMFPAVKDALLTSLEFFVITTVISVPLGLLFAYYIFKKAVGGKMFRFFLFLPSIVSSMVMVVLFSEFLDTAAADILFDWFGINLKGQALFNALDRSSYKAVLFFYIWTNFGTTTLIYSNKMSELPPETLEAAQLDGVNSFQEFIYIVLPFAFPTASVFLVTGVATICTNQYNIFSFYGGSVAFDSGTMGYYLFNLVQDYASRNVWDVVWFNRAAALSLVVTVIVIPITLGVRWVLDKYGPQE